MNMMFSFCYLVLLVNIWFQTSIVNIVIPFQIIWNPIIIQMEIFNLLKQWSIIVNLIFLADSIVINLQYSACRVLDGMWSWTQLPTADWRSSTRRCLSCSWRRSHRWKNYTDLDLDGDSSNLTLDFSNLTLLHSCTPTL